MRIGQPEKTHDHVKWNDDHDRREHVGEEDQPCDRLPPIAFSASSLMQNGVSMWRAAGFLGMSVETLDRVYGHHHPDYLSDAAVATRRPWSCPSRKSYPHIAMVQSPDADHPIIQSA